MDEPLVVAEEEIGQRLDLWLKSRFPNYSRTYFQSLIEKKLVLLNGNLAPKRTKLAAGDEIEVEFALTKEIKATPEDIPLDILFEDSALLAINKPAGMVVHPAPGHPNKTFVNALLFHLKKVPTEDAVRPGIVHRLDKDTSGILLAAKTPQSHEEMVNSFAHRHVKKTYLAIVNGNPGVTQTIDVPIGRDPKNRQKMAVTSRGKRAISHVKRLDFDGEKSLVEVDIETGRTHQIRVHLNYIKTPIIGDCIYGNKKINEKWKAERQMLHAYKLSLPHPTTKETLFFRASPPEDFKKLCNAELLSEIT